MKHKNIHFKDESGKEWCVGMQMIETDFKCLYCGKAIGYANNYCGKCGKKLNWPTIAVTEDLSKLN
jgi:predicted amidophosphoribosyltransferase